MSTNKPQTWLPWLCLIFTILTWGSAYAVIRLGLQEFPPVLLGFFRYSIASVVMLLLFWRFTPQKTLFRHWRPTLLSMLTGVIGIGIYNITLNTGELKEPAATAGFVIGVSPVIVTCISAFLFKERVSILGWLGTLVSFLGLAIIFISQNTKAIHIDLPFLLLLACVLCSATYTLLQKPLLKYLTPIEIVTGAMLGGTLTMSYALALDWKTLISHPPDSAGIWAVVYLGIIPASLAYLCYAYSFKYLPTAKATISLYLVPVAGVFIGWWLLMEIPNLLELLGGLVALAGALVVSRMK